MIASETLEQKLPVFRVGQSGLDFVECCLQMDPNKRPSSGELLKHPYIYSSRMSQFMAQTNNLALQQQQQQSLVNHHNERKISMTNSQSLMLLASTGKSAQGNSRRSSKIPIAVHQPSSRTNPHQKKLKQSTPSKDAGKPNRAGKGSTLGEVPRADGNNDLMIGSIADRNRPRVNSSTNSSTTTYSDSQQSAANNNNPKQAPGSISFLPVVVPLQATRTNQSKAKQRANG